MDVKSQDILSKFCVDYEDISRFDHYISEEGITISRGKDSEIQ